MSKSKNVLIVFVRNLQPGKVKTRIAIKTSDAYATALYRLLLDNTRKLVSAISPSIRIIIYYSEYIEVNDSWTNIADKKVQSGNDLGKSMFNAFSDEFYTGADHVCIIGSDIYELRKGTIDSAFRSLNKNEVVIGPARDGGYYLLGMNNLNNMLFENKSWSTNKVFKETIEDLKGQNIPFGTLEELTDIDEPEDIPPVLARKLVNMNVK